MPTYRIANLTIDSAIALRGLRASRSVPGAWTFVMATGRSRPACRSWYHHETLPGGARWRSLARVGDSDAIRFWRRAVFLVSFPARRIVCYPCRSASRETIQQLLIGHIVPLVLAGRATLALHASAVSSPHGALAFVAQSGGGKSTIAAALGQRGCAVLADDCTIVDVDARSRVCRVRPLDVGLRLWPATVSMLRKRESKRSGGGPKRRVTGRTLGITVRREPERLRCVYLLQRGRGTRRPIVEAVSRRDAVVALLVASFHLGLDEVARRLELFEKLSTLALGVPVLRLSFPSGRRHLPAVVDAVLASAGRSAR